MSDQLYHPGYETAVEWEARKQDAQPTSVTIAGRTFAIAADAAVDLPVGGAVVCCKCGLVSHSACEGTAACGCADGLHVTRDFDESDVEWAARHEKFHRFDEPPNPDCGRRLPGETDAQFAARCLTPEAHDRPQSPGTVVSDQEPAHITRDPATVEWKAREAAGIKVRGAFDQVKALKAKAAARDDLLELAVSRGRELSLLHEQIVESAVQFRAITGDFPGLTGPLVELFKGVK